MAECRCGAVLFRMLPLFPPGLLTGLGPDGLPLAGPVGFPEYVLAALIIPEVCPPGLRLLFSLISLIASGRIPYLPF